MPVHLLSLMSWEGEQYESHVVIVMAEGLLE